MNLETFEKHMLSAGLIKGRYDHYWGTMYRFPNVFHRDFVCRLSNDNLIYVAKEVKINTDNICEFKCYGNIWVKDIITAKKHIKLLHKQVLEVKEKLKMEVIDNIFQQDKI